MTLPSEGINPWRAAPAQTGPAALPPAKLSKDEALSSTDEASDGGKEFKAFGEDGLTFLDLVDIVNPLQHIPVISTVYREITDDTLDPAPRVMGDTLYMGPIGLAASVVNVLIEHNTGKDVGGHVVAMFRDDAEPLNTKTASTTAPAAAGTDGSDPVTQWAAQQTAFYRGDNAGAGVDDPVTRWAREQQAFYQGNNGANTTVAETDSVTSWAQAQTAYYQAGTQATELAAAGTDGLDVSAWAAEQNAYYRAGQSAVATNTATANDTVSDWARSQVAYYQGGAETAAASAQRREPTQTAANAGSDMDVTTWARDQLAWVMGDRAREVAALPTAAPKAEPNAGQDKSEHGSGAIDRGDGWFRDNMVQGWSRYQAAQRLAEPGYRPDLNMADNGR